MLGIDNCFGYHVNITCELFANLSLLIFGINIILGLGLVVNL